MKLTQTTFSNALGIAFLLQATTSLISGIIFNSLTDKNNIIKTVSNLTHSQLIAWVSIILEIITALGIIWLGVMLFRLVRNINLFYATTALCLYIIEAFLLLWSRFFNYRLLQLSMNYIENENTNIEILGKELLQMKDYIGNISTLVFAIGALLFYYLLFESEVLPSWLPLWGLLTIFPVLLDSIFAVLYKQSPFLLEVMMIPYIPFEFIVGLFILMRGLLSKL